MVRLSNLVSNGLRIGPANGTSGTSQHLERGKAWSPGINREKGYVDSNSGSSSAPWRAIQHAAYLVMSGTIHVVPGTYPEAVVVSNYLLNLVDT